ncbi:agmatine coumaroyltransferase-2-like protein [Cinnamomum micranthum f. kanehirae]|uniref:Agmatine coumaroyltransferase-2-like protein n=1 Tax=Cinnamomum micranthum f. kanehirae TaxID=337451 RepID=A0A3S3Q9U9_9MAGN|nr:agmatine coumaroyltransferase-2-like protein [Cinnamomum micranthum f. kanehirae]
MKVRKESSRIVKPSYEGQPPSTTQSIPLSVFDKVTYDTHIAVVYAFKPPTPPNTTIQTGLQKVLAVYRQWAGRLGTDDNGRPAILLNDEGVRFVDASADCTLDQAMPLKPSMTLLSFHPTLKGVDELVQVQITRFACGSMVLGFTAHHLIADGHSTSNFLIAWGQASRGLDMSPLPIHDRTIFIPHDPPHVKFEHERIEFMSKKLIKEHPYPYPNTDYSSDGVIVHKVHFTLEFLTKLKAKASAGRNRPYSTFESLIAHLWRAITQARGLKGFETTHVRISVNGRARLSPRVPNEYFGNLVLWAFPRAKVKELLQESLRYAANLIHDAVSKVNDDYFKSFIDFASNEEAVKDLVPTADMCKSMLCPNLEVDSWLRFPFYDLDFGGGSPYIFMPSYFPVEGMLFLLPSFIGDGSIDAIVPLFEQDLVTFKKICYSLD